KKKVLTREERIAELEKQKVLNGRVFDHEILTCVGLPMKFLKGEHQLFFEVVNKLLLPRTEKRTMGSSTDLFLMEQLYELEAINRPRIMIEHMHQIMPWRNAKYGIAYGYLLNLVFIILRCPLVERLQVLSSRLSLWPHLSSVNVWRQSWFQVIELLEKQETLKCEMDHFTTLLGAKDVEISRRQTLLQ
ncbi:hypothetical protein MTR67_042876, partial [Solanum verrucosum]